MIDVISWLRGLTRKHAVRQGGVVLIDQGTLSLATFVAGILVARACTPQVYGLYVLGWSILLILQGFHRALVNIPFTVYAPRLNHKERVSYQGSALVHTILVGLVTVFVLCVLWIWDPIGQEPKLAGLDDLLLLLAATAIPFLTRDFMRNSMLAQLDVTASVFVNLAATAILLSVMVVLFAWDHLTLAISFYVYTLTSTLATAYMLWTYRSRTRVIAGRIWNDFKKNWKIGKWIIVNTVGYTVAYQAYPWMLLYFKDAEAVAVFGVCLAVAGLLTPLLRGAAAYILPRMAHAYKDGNHVNLARMLRLSMLVLTMPFGAWLVIGGLFGDQIVTLFYSDAYRGYGLLVTLLLGKTFIESASTPLNNALQVLERTDIGAASLPIGIVVTLGLGSMMIYHFGVTGAGYAAVLSSAAMATWKWLGIRKILHEKKQKAGYGTAMASEERPKAIE